MKGRLRLSIGGTLRFCMVLILTAWLWWYFRSYFLFIALLLIVLSVLVSIILFWKNKDGIRVRAELPADHAARGKAFPFTIIMENPSRFAGFGAEIEYRFGNVFTQGYETKRQRVWIAPRRGVCMTQRLECGYAGRIDVTFQELTVRDAFHIMEYTVFPENDAWTMIYPVRSTREEDELSSIVEGFPAEEETKKRGAEYNPDYEVREYAAGDELKNIHWKLTAKRDRLMVRERLAEGREKVNVLLPLGQEKEENDRLMDAFSSVCALLIEKGYPVQVFWPGGEKDLRSGYAAEQGELDGITAEILSADGLHQPGAAVQQMAFLHPGEAFILIQAGAYEGVYVRS